MADEKKSNSVIKKVGAVVGGLALVSAGFVGGSFYSPVEKEVQVFVPQEVIVEKVVEVPVEIEVEKIVSVEDPYLKEALVARDIVDDEFDPVEVFMAEDMAIAKAIAEAEDKLADMLDDAGLIKDEDDFEILRVYSDYEDIEVVKSDFEDEEYKFVIKFKVEDTKKEDKFYVLATVKVDEDVEVTKVEKAE